MTQTNTPDVTEVRRKQRKARHTKKVRESSNTRRDSEQWSEPTQFEQRLKQKDRPRDTLMFQNLVKEIKHPANHNLTPSLGQITYDKI